MGAPGLIAGSHARAASPYPGKTGVTEKGELTDLLLIKGDPLENYSCRVSEQVNVVPSGSGSR